MYSQICYDYQQFSQKKRASMHISRKLGAQVDWAGNYVHIINRITGELIPDSLFVEVLSYNQFAFTQAS